MHTVRITRVRLSEGGYLHEHITHLEFQIKAGKVDVLTKPQMVQLVQALPSESVYVETVPGTKTGVVVVTPVNAEPYLRTHANEFVGDNLLSLPRF